MQCEFTVHAGCRFPYDIWTDQCSYCKHREFDCGPKRQMDQHAVERRDHFRDDSIVNLGPRVSLDLKIVSDPVVSEVKEWQIPAELYHGPFSTVYILTGPFKFTRASGGHVELIWMSFDHKRFHSSVSLSNWIERPLKAIATEHGIELDLPVSEWMVRVSPSVIEPGYLPVPESTPNRNGLPAFLTFVNKKKRTTTAELQHWDILREFAPIGPHRPIRYPDID